MTQFPTDTYGLVRRSNALAADFSDDELATAVRTQELIRLTPGVYADGAADYTGVRGATELFRLRSIAVATSTTPQRHPLSHTSAAAVHGLPLLSPAFRNVHLTTGECRGGGIRSRRHVHPAALDDDEIVVVNDIRVTSLERTAVDVALMGDFAQALTIFDGALHAGADRERMAASLLLPRPGIRPARRALPAAHPGAESAGESWSRAQLLEAGLPAPIVQQRAQGRSGKWYRCDFGLGGGLLGEFDGLHKYGRLLRPGETARDAVVREKIREDDLRAAGYMVLRWTWDDLRYRRLVGMLTPWLERFRAS